MAKHLDDAIEMIGGQAALAKALRVTRSAVNHWVKEGKVPINRVVDVERITGIERKKLRPDIFGDAA